jgi:hypothetical protein
MSFLRFVLYAMLALCVILPAAALLAVIGLPILLVLLIAGLPVVGVLVLVGLPALVAALGGLAVLALVSLLLGTLVALGAGVLRLLLFLALPLLVGFWLLDRVLGARRL